MTEPYELCASDAIKQIQNKTLSIHEWVLSCLKRIKEKDIIFKGCLVKKDSKLT